MNASYLSPEQKASFQENGFLVIPDCVPAAARDRLTARAGYWVAALADEWEAAIFSTREQRDHSNRYFLESGDKIRVFMEEEKRAGLEGHRVNKLGHALHELDPEFRAFSYQPTWGQIAADLGLSQAGLLQSMYIFKQPHIGGEVSIHQDSTFLYTEPLSVLGFWFAMQDATLENGCLWALPGGHREALRTRFVREGFSTRFELLSSIPLPETGYVPLPVSAGSLILLHGLLPHYSEANRSTQPRQAYALHVVDRTAHYPADNWLQRGADMPLRGFQEVRTRIDKSCQRQIRLRRTRNEK